MKKFPVGFHFTIKRTGNGILKEIWQETGDNGDKPGENWKKIKSWLEKTEFNPPSDHIDPSVGRFGPVKEDKENKDAQ